MGWGVVGRALNRSKTLNSIKNGLANTTIVKGFNKNVYNSTLSKGLGWGTRKMLVKPSVAVAKGLGTGSIIVGKQGAKMGAQTYDYWKNQTAKLRGQKLGQPFQKRNYVARNVREGCIDVRTFGGKYECVDKQTFTSPVGKSMRHRRRNFNRNRTQRKPNVRS